MGIMVSTDNFVRAETDRMFFDLQESSGGIGVFRHNRTPAAIDEQTVIRLNRDTLYSFAVVDLEQDATLTIPPHGDRYLSVMVVNNDHFINAVFHDAGEYTLSQEVFETRYAMVAARILADPNDAEDLATVAQLQDQLTITSHSSVPFVMPDYDTASFDATRTALLRLADQLATLDHMFGSRNEVDPVRHLIGSAAGWGGLPTTEASYLGRPGMPEGRYELVMADVPVDAFWSLSVYNEAGYFEPNDRGVYSVNSVTGVRDADGAIRVRLGDFPPDTPNAIPTPQGWNYLVRFYRPRSAFLDGSWTLPELQRV